MLHKNVKLTTGKITPGTLLFGLKIGLNLKDKKWIKLLQPLFRLFVAWLVHGWDAKFSVTDVACHVPAD